MGSKPTKASSRKGEVFKVKQSHGNMRETNSSTFKHCSAKHENDNIQSIFTPRSTSGHEKNFNRQSYKGNKSNNFSPSTEPRGSILYDARQETNHRESGNMHAGDVGNRRGYKTNHSGFENDNENNDSFSTKLHARMLRGETYDGEVQELNERPFHEEKVRRIPTRAHLRPPKSPDCVIADPNAEGEEYEYMEY